MAQEPALQESAPQKLPLQEQSLEEVRAQAEAGDAAAQTELGMRCMGSRIGANTLRYQYEYCYDCPAGFQWFQKAAAQNYPYAQFWVGQCYEYALGVNVDLDQAVKWYQLAADQNEPNALCYLGRIYSGLYSNVPTDWKKAVALHLKAANLGFIDAQFELALKYYHGYWGLPQDFSAAAEWYRKAGEQGLWTAQFNLGLMYSKGEGVAQDGKEAVRWFEKAASGQPRGRFTCNARSHADADSMYQLGRIYSMGLPGVEKDAAKTAYWYNKCADAGSSDGLIGLGSMYEFGWGVKKDYKKAEEYYRKAYGHGNSKAAYYLGMLYFEGKKDKSEGRMWLLLAAELGNEDALTKLNEFYGKNKVRQWLSKRLGPPPNG